jgi:hypothetical protein
MQLVKEKNRIHFFLMQSYNNNHIFPQIVLLYFTLII